MAKINAINNKSEELTIDPGASGDSFIQFDINTTGEFRIGVDDTDSDKFKISQGSALGTNDTFEITANGEITKELTSAFLATTNGYTNQDNVTGDGTVHTVEYTTEYFDQNADFDGTSTFTAPVTGRYRICATVLFDEAGAATSSYIEIEASNRTFRSWLCDPSTVSHAAGQFTPFITALVDMDASDTAIIKVMASGTTKVVDIGFTNRGIFSAVLVC